MVMDYSESVRSAQAACGEAKSCRAGPLGGPAKIGRCVCRQATLPRLGGTLPNDFAGRRAQSPPLLTEKPLA